jgi:hypothetical protein
VPFVDCTKASKSATPRSSDISQGWTQELLHRYPTAELLGAASAADLDAIAYLPAQHIEPLLPFENAM